MARYTKKPVTIDAIQYVLVALPPAPPPEPAPEEPGELAEGDETVYIEPPPQVDPPPSTNLEEILAWGDGFEDPLRDKVSGIGSGIFIIQTLAGGLTVSPGDWIIRGIMGEYYPCSDDVFVATYNEGEPA